MWRTFIIIHDYLLLLSQIQWSYLVSAVVRVLDFVFELFFGDAVLQVGGDLGHPKLQPRTAQLWPSNRLFHLLK